MSTTSGEDLALIEADLAKLLLEQHICILGTVAVTGGALVHGMHYVSDDLTVYVSSLRGTRKLFDIQKEPRVSYVVWSLPGHDNRHEARNLQMQAIAELVANEAERKRAADLMGEKEPWSKGSLLMRTNRWIRLKPVQAMWQHGSEQIDSRQILHFSPNGRVTEAVLYPSYMKEVYAVAAGNVIGDEGE